MKDPMVSQDAAMDTEEFSKSSKFVFNLKEGECDVSKNVNFVLHVLSSCVKTIRMVCL
jgi:hypothetical protein